MLQRVPHLHLVTMQTSFAEFVYVEQNQHTPESE